MLVGGRRSTAARRISLASAGLAGVDQERPPLQLVEGLGPAGDRLDVDRVVGVEPDVVQAAEGRRVLVLAADRLAEDVDLDPAGLLGQRRVADHLVRGSRTGR